MKRPNCRAVAFVVGSAVYVGHWEKAAVQFVREHETVLADRPTWLFSSGPLGFEPTDAEGRDKRETAVPQEIAPLTALPSAAGWSPPPHAASTQTDRAAPVQVLISLPFSSCRNGIGRPVCAPRPGAESAARRMQQREHDAATAV